MGACNSTVTNIKSLGMVCERHGAWYFARIHQWWLSTHESWQIDCHLDLMTQHSWHIDCHLDLMTHHLWQISALFCMQSTAQWSALGNFSVCLNCTQLSLSPLGESNQSNSVEKLHDECDVGITWGGKCIKGQACWSETNVWEWAQLKCTRGSSLSVASES